MFYNAGEAHSIICLQVGSVNELRLPLQLFVSDTDGLVLSADFGCIVKLASTCMDSLGEECYGDIESYVH